jgi:D-arabinose 5-phosphate isomerase GutQ
MSKYHSHYCDVLAAEAKAIEDLQNKLNFEVMDRVVELLLTVKKENRRIITSGCGTSGQVAKKVAHSLTCIGLPASFLSPADSAHGGLNRIQTGDIVVLFAKGGNTQELQSYYPVCLKRSAVVIGVTNNQDSFLAKKSDIVLLIDSGEEPDMWKMMPASSIVAAIALWDAIIFTVMRYNGFTKEEFLLVHPGGATGAKLSQNIQ